MQVIIAAVAGGLCVYVYWLKLLLGMLRALNSYHQQTNHSVLQFTSLDTRKTLSQALQGRV
jgi:hypothetical protein